MEVMPYITTPYLWMQTELYIQGEGRQSFQNTKGNTTIRNMDFVFDASTGNLLNTRGQSIEYNALNKATILIDNDAYRLEITCGPDGQRWKTVLQKNSSVIKTVIFAGDYEKVTEDGVTKELIYLPGGAVHVRQAGQADKIYYTHTDHLGSIISITDNNGTPVFKVSYDAQGKQIIINNTIGFHRAYTGHEHLPEFGLINMNGRMYDPIVGRFLSPDPYVQAPEFSQSFNRYSYALNNPLIYTDPSGEFSWLIAAAAAYTLFFTDVGYDVQKFISPVAVKFEVHPFGSDERFFGVKTSVGLPHISQAAYRWEWGANYYTRFYDTGWQGWETTQGEEYSLLGVYSASFTEYTMHGMDDFNQTFLRLKWGGPGLNASYYNDYIHKDKFKFFRKLTPDRIIEKGDDRQDRWRTAATHVQLGPLSVGMKVITGDPGPYGKRYEGYYEDGYPYYVASKDGKYDPGKYSEGIFYIGVGPFRIGRNSEDIRNYFQNEMAHKPENIPFFPVIPGKKPRWYWFW